MLKQPQALKLSEFSSSDIRYYMCCSNRSVVKSWVPGLPRCTYFTISPISAKPASYEEVPEAVSEFRCVEMQLAYGKRSIHVHKDEMLSL